MATITLTVYLTNTLTPISEVSVAAWNSDNSSVSASGKSNGSGVITLTLSNGTYTLRGFKSGYTFLNATLTVSGNASVSFEGDVVPNLVKNYSYYEEQVKRNLGNRVADTSIAATIMTNFNLVQELLCKVGDWEDLEEVVNPSLVTSQNAYTYSQLGFSSMYHKIYSIKLYTDSKWYPPMEYVTPIKWDRNIAPLILMSTGKPYTFTRYKKNILFYKTPDSTYPIEIRASLYPNVIVQSSDPVSFISIDSILINLTTAYTYLSYQEKDLASSYFRIATQLLKSHEVDLNSQLNFAAFSSLIGGTIQDYWANPFIRRVP